MNTRIKITLSALLTAGLLAVPLAANATPPGHGHDPVSICHSGDGTNFTYIAPDSSGLNGHQHHAADQFGLSEAACLALNPPPVVTPTYIYEVGYYVYKKLDPAIPAAWENSGEQTLITVQPGTEWLSTPALPEWVCGEGWGYQQDKVKHDGSLIFPEHITYPNDSGMGWPPIYEAKHGELTVPACPPVVPEKPTPRPFEDQRDDFTCETVTEYRATGFFDLTLIDNVWIENATPTLTSETSSVRATTAEERLGRDCEEPPVVTPPTELPTPTPPAELAETGENESVTWFWIIAGGLTIALGTLLAWFSRKKEEN